MKNEPRGLRNNNPLNIRYVEKNRWQGRVKTEDKKDQKFEEFVSLKWGFRAAFILLHNYTTLFGKRTIKDIITTWAPPSDGNNTNNYIKHICEDLSAADYCEIRFEDGTLMCGLVRAMARIEVGKSFELPIVMTGYYLACKSLGVKPNWYNTKFHEAIYEDAKKLQEEYGTDLL